MFYKSIAIFILSLPALAGCSGAADITAFKNVHLVPMTDEKIIKNQTVIVEGNRIKEIGLYDKVNIPKKANVIDGSGAYLMPGLADMHVHLKGKWPLPQSYLYLANGVTTVRDLDGGEYILQWRDEINAGQRVGPAIYASSPIIRGYEKNPAELVAKYKSRYDCVKLYSYFSKTDFEKAMQTAKAHDVYTVGHIPFAVGLDGAIAAGMNEIAHVEELDFEFIEFDRTRELKPAEWWPYIISSAVKQNERSGINNRNLKAKQQARLQEVISKLQSAGIPVCSTLSVGSVIVQKLCEPTTFLERPQNRYLPLNYKEAFSQGEEKHQMQFKGNKDAALFKYDLDKTLLAELHRAGISIILGTDAGTGGMGIVPGFSIHDELRILTENGFSPYEAIATGTVNASNVVKAMTGRDEFGTIEAGKRADFILVNQNPLDAVTHIRDHRGVMANGKWYARADLEKMIDPTLLPDIPIFGGITNICGPDGNSVTNIEFFIGKSFTGQLPEDIDSITVKGPNGNLPIDKSDFNYIARLRDFYVQIPGSPVPGAYTITVKSGEKLGSTKDTQHVLRNLPLPDSATLSPTEGEILSAKTPIFSWGAVKAPDTPLYFLFQIQDTALNTEVFRINRTQNVFSSTIPDGVLIPGRSYRWRIRISDDGHWIKEQNRTQTGWRNFTMADLLE